MEGVVSNLHIGSLPVSVSYLVLTGALLEMLARESNGAALPQWSSTPIGATIEPGLRAAQLSPPYVLRASEEASFIKTFRRSPRVVSTGEFR